MRKNYGFSIFIIITFLVIFSAYYLSTGEKSTNNTYSSKTFSIISSEENKELENDILSYAKSKKYDIKIEYDDTLNIMSRLNNGEKHDAVWLSNSIWIYMLDNVNITDSKSTSINPIIFGIKKSKAEELGFIGKDIYTKDILDAINNGSLKFSMSNPINTNSGASAYLGILSVLAGNPEVLTEDMLDSDELQENVKNFFTGLERTSGSEDFLEELFLNGDYEAVVTYESSIININKKLIKQNKEPLYAIYPIDGVSISDSPFGYIDNKDEKKKAIFDDLKNYLLSNDGQKILEKYGRRTWYGGINENTPKDIFNPDFGIDTSKYISPIKYPSTKVIRKALNLYQTALRKPIHVVFALDYSGSMQGQGFEDLKKAMNYILTEEAAKDLLQFSSEDKIDIIPFNSNIGSPWSTQNGLETEYLLQMINYYKPGGSTALFPAAQQAIKLLKDEDQNKYNTSVILMTDGEGNVGKFKDLYNTYKQYNKDIPIYSITFGDADETQLREIAKLTNAKVFDGKNNLIGAFKEVRGYN